MKRLLPLAILVCLAAAAMAASFQTSDRQLTQPQTVQALNGSPTYLGTVAVTDAGSVTNWSTASAFDAGFGNLLVVQCDSATYFSTSGTASSTSGLSLDAREKFYCMLTPIQSTVAVKPESGASTTCKVFRVQ